MDSPTLSECVEKKNLDIEIPVRLIRRGEELSTRPSLSRSEIVELKDITTCLFRIACEMKFQRVDDSKRWFSKGDEFLEFSTERSNL
jgi:hypothetical protein